MKLSLISVSGLLFSLLVTSSVPLRSQDSTKPSKLAVHVEYTGSGTVDEKHKIYVVLWDSPGFTSGEAAGPPVELIPLVSKQGTALFENVKQSPAYISTVYDASGAWNTETGPPPDGCSLGLYHKTADKAEPIPLTPGTTAKISLSFDDSMKMKGGQAAH